MAQVSSVIGDSLVMRTAKIAVNNGSGSFGTVRDLYAGTALNVSPTLISAIREGYGKRLAAFSKISGATISLEIAANQLQIFADIMGLTYAVTGSTPNQVGKMEIKDLSIPYIALAAGLDDDGGLENALHVWIPRMKLTGDSVSNLIAAAGTQQIEYARVTLEFEVFPDAFYLSGAENEVQTLDLDGATGGTFTLSLGSDTTTALNFDDDAATIQAALEALNNIGSGNVAVATGSDFTITFQGTLANAKLPLVTINDGSLTGTSTGATIVRTTAGSPGNDLIFTIYEDEQGTTPLIPPAL